MKNNDHGIPRIQPSLLDSINSNFGEYPQDFLCFFVIYYFGEMVFFQVNIILYFYSQGYISSKGTYEELKCFIKPFTIKPFIRLETSSNPLNSHQKILYYNFRLVESSFRSIDSSRDSRFIFLPFRSIEPKLRLIKNTVFRVFTEKITELEFSL